MTVRKSAAKKLISILQLGTVDYATALSLQQRLVGLHKDGRIGDVLLLLEHTPVITLGRNAKAKNVLASPEVLARRGVEVFECDRGGDVTFHGPGQLVGYPIFDLRGFPAQDARRAHLGAVDYVRHLEEVLIRTCADFGIPTKRIPGLTGVWTDVKARVPAPAETAEQAEPKSASCGSETHPPAVPGDRNPQDAKIAALGVHISRGVTSHGFALNISTDLSYFNLIVPCGIESKPVTSMAKELGKAPDAQAVMHSVSRHFGQVFQSQILWLESLDGLNPTVGVPMKPPMELRELHREDETFWS